MISATFPESRRTTLQDLLNMGYTLDFTAIQAKEDTMESIVWTSSDVTALGDLTCSECAENGDSEDYTGSV